MTQKIKVPKTPKSAYHPERPMNELQRSQLEQFYAAFGWGGLTETGLKMTEGQAAIWIGYYTKHVTR